MVVDTFVPNDTVMRRASDRIQVVTGPNFSGKICYAKQVALIVFLSHVGSFVPAQQARPARLSFPYVDKIQGSGRY